MLALLRNRGQCLLQGQITVAGNINITPISQRDFRVARILCGHGKFQGISMKRLDRKSGAIEGEG